MKTDELLYPPGTLVARWYAFRHDWPYATADKAGDVRVAILRVNNNGYYEQGSSSKVAFTSLPLPLVIACRGRAR